VTVPSPDEFGFDLVARHGDARLGRLRTPHGVVETPAFVAVGTSAAVKGMRPSDLRSVGQQAIFANTYHLALRPGAELVAEMGGLHQFMAWDRPIFTDSGGFQVFSLGASLEQNVGKIGVFPGEGASRRRPGGQGSRSLVKIDEQGVSFRSHLDGSRQELSPESSIAIQKQLGADVILAFDECTSPLHDEEYTGRAAERTHRWAKRSLDAFHAAPPPHGARQALYGIVQGGWFESLRTHSADVIAGLPFDGIAVGGSLGRTKADMRRVLEITTPRLPDALPRHLLGIGDVPDLFAAVARGLDTFDCVSPTRNARNGGLLARRLDDEPLEGFRMNLRNARFARDERPVEAECPCPLCTQHTRAYLRHLFKAEGLLACQLATMHNLTFMNRLMADVRAALAASRLEQLTIDWLGEARAEALLSPAVGR
jgi:tRNA-guanine transglycosylase